MELTEMPYRHRDLSWLTFNYRVLQEAKDISVPLLERIKFLAIYSSNLDEFYRVRVAHHQNLLRIGKKTRKQLGYEPEYLLKKIQKIVNTQQTEFSAIFQKEIIPQLSKNRIYIRDNEKLKPYQIQFIEDYFQENLLPYAQPVLLEKKKIKLFLKNASLYLAVHLLTKNRSAYRFAIVQVPSEHLPRFVQLPSPEDRYEIILLDDIVRHSINLLFPGYHIENTYSIKLTRDAELYIEDEYSGNLIEKIKRSISKRNLGPATRFVYDRNMNKKLLEFLMEDFDLKKENLLPEGRYHNNSDFFKFPDFDQENLKNIKLEPLKKNSLEEYSSIFRCMRKKDHIVHFPYHSYKYVVRFFDEAANDPDVTHIKIIQYRVAPQSKIMDSLIRAAKSGKQVTAFVEVKARFDEEANLAWAERLKKAGVKVFYSFPGLKVHAKLAIVTRKENTQTTNYSYMGTGNFHEGTARVYSDSGLFTTDTKLTDEVARVFNHLENIKAPTPPFNHLLIGQFNLRDKLHKLIDKEIKNAKSGKKGLIILKLNSLQDPEMINRLYEASNAGVKVKLIIRGICSIIPDVKGYSENIQIISIVDRFLEHARIYYFYNNGKQIIYLSSADWMTRNLSHRIEAAFPIYDPDIHKEIRDLLRIQLKDNVKARIIDGKKDSTYKNVGGDKKVRAQLESYYYLKRKMEIPIIST